MAESNSISRKRLRFTSSSATEILTTIKLQKQRDLSARIAPVVSQIGTGSGVHPSPSLNGKIDSKIIRRYPRVTIKDLRLRRVFSPNSDYEFSAEGVNKIKEQDDERPCDSRISSGTQDFIQTTSPDPEMLKAVNESAVKKSDTDLCSKSVLHPCSRAKIYKNPGSFSYRRLLPYLMQAADDGTSSSRCLKPEKSLSQNPPNVSLSCDKETGETAGCSKEEVSELMTAKCQLPESIKQVSQSVDVVLNNHSARSVCENSSPLKNVNASSPLKNVNASSPIKKSAYSRRKLFKTPGSVNYRRMLPYLKDIQEDNPCVPETVNHEDHQKNTEVHTPSSMLISENEGMQETVTSDVAKESDIYPNENKELLPCEHVSVSPERSDSDKEQETQVKHVIPDTEKNLETPHNVLDSVVPLSSPLVGSTGSVEVASSPNTLVDDLVGDRSINGVEKTAAKITAEQLEAENSKLTAELFDLSPVSATPPSISPSKGILKRSIRGCRGICSCLNCSSFRLNAERAFEFSRNQLQDTEVMVLDLVQEISHLRDMLEKHNSADHNESYKTQAGEAGKRAWEAAELAKSRLHQMNDALQVHCRIPNEQRARVKFAHYVHEKTILNTSEPNNLMTRSP